MKAMASKGAQENVAIVAATYGIDAEEQYYLITYYYRCKGLLAPKHRYKPLTEHEKQEIVKLHVSGVSMAGIARRLQRHVSTIYYFLKRLENGGKR